MVTLKQPDMVAGLHADVVTLLEHNGFKLNDAQRSQLLTTIQRRAPKTNVTRKLDPDLSKWVGKKVKVFNRSMSDLLAVGKVLAVVNDNYGNEPQLRIVGLRGEGTFFRRVDQVHALTASELGEWDANAA